MSSVLQFGFKPGFSTDLCSNVLKNTVSTYLHNGSNVYACFLDASKAFDRVDHSKLFDILVRRSLPPPLLAFLQNWYKDQAVQVRWNDVLSQPFGVSNGVRQGGVLSPILFTVYIDELINMLSQQDIGCHYGPYFFGVLGYADDIVLLSPSPCSLRCHLTTCETFASSFNLTFNSSKSQLICFSKVKNSIPLNSFTFNGEHLQAVSSVIHLGHRYTQTLDDSDDIQLATSEMCRRANCFFQPFSFCDPIVKTFIFQTYCLSLYGACTWKLDCKKLQSLIVAFNNSLRKIWNLPRSTHTGVLHCASGLGSIINKIIKISLCHIVTSCNSSSRFISFIFRDCCTKVYTPIGLNVHCATDFVKHYSQTDLIIGYLVRNLCLVRVNSRNFSNTYNELISSLCCY